MIIKVKYFNPFFYVENKKSELFTNALYLVYFSVITRVRKWRISTKDKGLPKFRSVYSTKLRLVLFSSFSAFIC